MNEVRCGDCLWALEDVEEGAVDLIITSPPYAMRRKGTYGGVPEAEYVDWFCERADQFERVLSVFGSFVLNIKEHCVDGERHRYVYDLVIALRDRGWLLVDELIWHKKNPMPGHWNCRLKDGFERLYHFTQKRKDFKFFPDAVRQPASASMIEKFKKGATGVNNPDVRSRSGSGHDIAAINMVRRARRKELSGTGSGFTKDREAEKTWTTARPSNVIHCSAETTNRGHSAVFPSAIPEFFVKLMTEPGDLVLDPFAGSGTSLEVAKRLGRRYLGVEIDEKYATDARERLARELV